MLRPLEQWVCDTCHEVIEAPTDGYLEWLHEDNLFTNYGFRIVHHSPRSPRQPHKNCYRYSNHLNRRDTHLNRFLGADGLGTLLGWVAPAPGHTGTRMNARDPEEVTDLIRRLHLPHYEEARQYFAEARANGFLADGDPSDWFRQEYLRIVIDQYAQDD